MLYQGEYRRVYALPRRVATVVSNAVSLVVRLTIVANKLLSELVKAVSNSWILSIALASVLAVMNDILDCKSASTAWARDVSLDKSVVNF